MAAPASGRNEVASVFSALGSLDLAGCVVTADALHCHPAMARILQARGAEYAGCIKGNDGPLRACAERAFAQAETGGHPAFSEQQNQGHGRWKWCCASVVPVSEGAPAFPDLTARGRIEAERETCGKLERSARYVALSRTMIPADLPAVGRSPWDIENGLHWPLDVVFHDDVARPRKDYNPVNLAILHRIALDILYIYLEVVNIKCNMWWY